MLVRLNKLSLVVTRWTVSMDTLDVRATEHNIAVTSQSSAAETSLFNVNTLLIFVAQHNSDHGFCPVNVFQDCTYTLGEGGHSKKGTDNLYRCEQNNLSTQSGSPRTPSPFRVFFCFWWRCNAPVVFVFQEAATFYSYNKINSKLNTFIHFARVA